MSYNPDFWIPKTKSRLKVIDLFCGVGGATLGFKKAGFDVILGVDINETVLSAYHENHPEVETWQRNIMELKAEDLPRADVILGSTPCQEFSIAKKNRTCDMTLTYHFLKIIYKYKPRFWILENVPGIAKFLHGVDYNILNVADYGVLQRRMRCMAGKYPLPEPTHAKSSNSKLFGGALKSWNTFGTIKHTDGARIVSKNGIAGAFRRANEMGQKGYRFDLQFIDENDIVPTISATMYHGLRASAPVIWDNGLLRQLSFIECARAQSFPDGYVFKGTQEQRYHQVGDAVPPLFVNAIARAIREKEEGGGL